MKTREQLVNRALQKLGALAAGQTASAEDFETVNNEIEPIMSDLAVRSIYYWGDPDQIDDSSFIHLADIVANSVARDYGAAQDDNVRRAAEQRLRELNVQTLSGQPQTVEYF